MRKFLVSSRECCVGVFCNYIYVYATDSRSALKRYAELLLDRGFTWDDIGSYEFSVECLDV